MTEQERRIRGLKDEIGNLAMSLEFILDGRLDTDTNAFVESVRLHLYRIAGNIDNDLRNDIG